MNSALYTDALNGMLTQTWKYMAKGYDHFETWGDVYYMTEIALGAFRCIGLVDNEGHHVSFPFPLCWEFM